MKDGKRFNNFQKIKVHTRKIHFQIFQISFLLHAGNLMTESSFLCEILLQASCCVCLHVVFIRGMWCHSTSPNLTFQFTQKPGRVFPELWSSSWTTEALFHSLVDRITTLPSYGPVFIFPSPAEYQRDLKLTFLYTILRLFTRSGSEARRTQI